MPGKRIAKILNKAQTPQARKEAAAYLSQVYSRPVRSIYREAREYGWESDRETRSDKGNGYHLLDREQLMAVVALMERARTKDKARMPLWRAIMTAENSGIIESGSLTEAALSRFMKENRLRKRELNGGESHIRLRSLYPNHVHMLDPSVCDQFYLKDDGTLARQDPEKEDYKNKDKARRQKIWRWLIADHCSGAFYWWYILAPGENTEDALNFGYKAWTEKEDPSVFPFHGVPESLVTDNAGWAKSSPFQSVMGGLGIRHIRNLAYNAQAKGAVETLHGWISAVFETGLRHDPATNIDELNEKAFDEAILLNGGRVHNRHGATRSAFWSYHIPQEKLRVPPNYEVYKSLANRKAEFRTVDRSLMVSYKTESYKVIDPDLMGEKVQVIENIYEPGVITLVSPRELGGQQYILSPLPRDDAGFLESAAIIGEEFKANKESTTTKRIKETGRVELPKIVPFGHAAKRIEKIAFLSRKGEPIEVEPEEARLPFLDAVLKIKQGLGRRLTVAENRSLRERYGESIPVAEIDDLVEELRHGEAQLGAV